jgi:hypothetical protein
MASDIHRASEYIQHLIDNNNNPSQPSLPETGDKILVNIETSSNTYH